MLRTDITETESASCHISFLDHMNKILSVSNNGSLSNKFSNKIFT